MDAASKVEGKLYDKCIQREKGKHQIAVCKSVLKTAAAMEESCKSVMA